MVKRLIVQDTVGVRHLVVRTSLNTEISNMKTACYRLCSTEWSIPIDQSSPTCPTCTRAQLDLSQDSPHEKK